MSTTPEKCPHCGAIRVEGREYACGFIFRDGVKNNPRTHECLLNSEVFAHAAILEPEAPLPRIVVPPDTYPAPHDCSAVKQKKAAPGDPLPWHWSATYCKRWYAEAVNEGLIVLSEDGQRKPGKYVRDWLKLQLLQGKKVLPMGKPCEGFSHVTGCPGHEETGDKSHDRLSPNHHRHNRRRRARRNHHRLARRFSDARGGQRRVVQ